MSRGSAGPPPADPPQAGAAGAGRADQTLLWLAAASFASMASMRICDPMLPALAQDFGVAAASASGVVTLYAIGYGVAQLAHGPLGDRVGKARYIAGAALVAALASLACALAPGLPALELARLLTGSIAAAIIPLSMAWVGDTVPYGQRQAALARFLNGTILGAILGQAMGGALADTFGWRSAFVILAGIFALSGWKLGSTVRSERRSGTQATRTPGGTAGGTAALARYRIVLGSGWARTILAIVAIEGLLAFGPLAFVPTALHERANMPIWVAGATVAAFGLGGFAYTWNAARLLARFGEPGLALGGGALMGSGFALLAAAPALGVLACVLLGLGYYMLHNTLQTHATQMAPAVRGTGVAMFAMCLFLGQSSGVSLAAPLVLASDFVALFAGAAAGVFATGAVFALLLQRRVGTKIE